MELFAVFAILTGKSLKEFGLPWVSFISLLIISRLMKIDFLLIGLKNPLKTLLIEKGIALL